jgi:hypothetical protein
VAAYAALVPQLSVDQRAPLVAELVSWMAGELPPLPRGHEDAYSSGGLDGRELQVVLALVAQAALDARAGLLDAIFALVAARPSLLGALDGAADALADAGDPEPTRARRWVALIPDGAAAVEELLALAARERRAGRSPDALVAEARARWDRLDANARGYLVYDLWEHAAWIRLDWLARAFEAWIDDRPRVGDLPRWAPALVRLEGEAFVTGVAEAFAAAE